ncbi:MAG: GMC family oxidoreductase, partial [Proteobacteria bacterium]|nr:GMC family oxidoreductase [Pseudomonadota bacterium]
MSADADSYDFIIVGSGFGGSVSALRLSEKGYRVLVIEKGRRFGRKDFPTTNWNVFGYQWLPWLGMRGPFKMNFFQHITALTGVGVGGGSLIYANTLPVPKEEFYTTGNWAGLADWQQELSPHYETATKMLGAVPNPEMTYTDEIIADLAKDLGREEHFHPTNVAVFFGEPEVEVPDPYFGGDGPDRVGCTKCGGCLVGCRVGAKNTLDLNYLYLAQQLGAEVIAETEVMAIRHREGRYVLETRSSFGWVKETKTFSADRVVLAGGVMGTIPLLLRMRLDPDGLPRLSDKVGRYVRTNNEAIMGVPTSRRDV